MLIDSIQVIVAAGVLVDIGILLLTFAKLERGVVHEAPWRGDIGEVVLLGQHVAPV